MKVRAHYTADLAEDDHVSTLFDWKKEAVEIKEDGKVILKTEVEVPCGWSNMAATILAHKYLRKSGVPLHQGMLKKYPSYLQNNNNNGYHLPDILQRSTLEKKNTPYPSDYFGAETSAKQVFHRLAGCWAYEGAKAKYFSDADAALTFYNEIYYMLAAQIAAPNSPQWFNTGLWWAYGIEGNGGAFRSSHIGAPAVQLENGYQHPQTSACFILGLEDKLLGDGGILDTLQREARIFKYGSGSGVNYSPLRPKNSPLSNGGVSSGLMSFLRLFDSNAGTIKSGGTTRRAARMVIVNADHPEAEDFVGWKAREEVKVRAMREGAKALRANEGANHDATLKALESSHFEGEAYNTVSGQNANNSLRVTDAFMATLSQDPSKVHDSERATVTRNHRLWQKAVQAAWECGDPGIQFHDTINGMHTIPKVAPQHATNPCSEYAFIDNSSCNLASLNLVQFFVSSTAAPLDDPTNQHPTRQFDDDSYRHAIRLWTLVLDISVGMSSYPDRLVAENSVNYRAIGLGYANLGGLLMLAGYPYDSEEGRAVAGLVTACLHGAAWEMSCQIASELGAFFDYPRHANDVRKVFDNHKCHVDRLLNRDAVQAIMYDKEKRGYPNPFSRLAAEVRATWLNSRLDEMTSTSGVRNAQLTLLAPTGTIGFVMDVATTGIEPCFALNMRKKLAGGGSLTITNPLVEQALANLGYKETVIKECTETIARTGGVQYAPLRREDAAIFACANEIEPSGHIDMMAKVQPFLSGAISKTVNMPADATITDVGDVMHDAWVKGLKAIAIYRDGCKASQPLNAVGTGTAGHQRPAPESSPSGPVKKPTVAVKAEPAKPIPTPDEHVRFTQAPRPHVHAASTDVYAPRKRLPSRRNGFTQKVVIGGNSLYVRTGEYEDGRLGEVFLTLGRDGSTMRHFLDSLAVSMSIGLQHGVPLSKYVSAYTDTRSEPCGPVQGSDAVRFCSSIMDYVVRELSAVYIPREEASMAGAGTPRVQEFTPTAFDMSKEGGLHYVKSTWEDDTLEVVHAPQTEAPASESAGIRTMSAGVVSLFKPQTKYTGNLCPSCKNATLRRAGSCHVCDSCGETTGCS